jgi:trigger factor
MANIVREDHDNLNVTLTLSIPVADYQPKFKAKLNEYRKKAHLKGFRKGKTPLTVVRKMYGREVLVDIINNIVGEELDGYLKKEKLDILGNPLPSKDQASFDFDPKNLEDFEFKYDLGLSPEFEVVGLEDTAFNRYNVLVPDSMVDDDLADAQKRLGEQKSVDDTIQEDDILRLQADELADGAVKEGGWANEFSVSYPELTDEAKAIFDGKQKGDVVEIDIFNLAKDKDEKFVRKYFLDVNEDADETPEIGNKFQATISDVTRLEPATLGQEFFDKYFGKGVVSSEEEAREKMNANIKLYYDRQADGLLYKEIKETLEEKNPLEFPKEFLKRWLTTSKRLPEGSTAEEEVGKLLKGLPWTLIRSKLSTRFDVTVTQEEIKQALRQQIISQVGGYDLGSIIDEYLETLMKNEEQTHAIFEQLLAEKLFVKLKETITTNENDISTEDFEKVMEEERAKNQPAPVAEADANDDEVEIEEVEVVEEEAVKEEE